GTTAVIEPEPAAEPPPRAMAPLAALPETRHDNQDVVPAVDPAAAPLPSASAVDAAAVPSLSASAGDAEAAAAAHPIQPKSPPVIPLVHAPDDPGPETVEETAAPAETKPNGWRSIFK